MNILSFYFSKYKFDCKDYILLKWLIYMYIVIFLKRSTRDEIRNMGRSGVKGMQDKYLNLIKYTKFNDPPSSLFPFGLAPIWILV